MCDGWPFAAFVIGVMVGIVLGGLLVMWAEDPD